jgi:hypothetical protein
MAGENYAKIRNIFKNTQKIFSSGFSSLNVFKAGFFKAKLSCTSRGQRLNVI